VIVQANDFTESTIRTVIGAVVTTNTRLAMAPGNVLLRRRETGLRSDSVANVSQLVTVSKELLTEKTGHLSPATLQRLDEGLRLVLSL
jgi:mRNA interferase MazF